MGWFRKKSRRFIPLEELQKMSNFPELPKTYKEKLWRTTRTKTTFTMAEETEHFLNMLCLHFGLGRSMIVTHAINLLWAEVVESIGAERMKLYEDKIEAVRLYRLETGENNRMERKMRLADKLEQMKGEGMQRSARIDSVATVWRFDKDKKEKKQKKASDEDE